jgi:uncharacterized protein (TIGR02145 family)
MLGLQNVVHFLVMSMTAGLLWGCSPGEPNSGTEVVSGAQDTAMMELGADTPIANKPWLNPDLAYGSVRDIDGNAYATIQIGKQVWMAENLRTTRYRDGSTIPNVTGNTAWEQLNSGAWCNYDNSPVNDTTYGKLYNWYAAANPLICPQGWHVPTDAEWTVLTCYLGGLQVAGGKMKSTGTQYWDAPNTGATNESGFSGLPGGFRHRGGSFYHLGDHGGWWSATESADYAWGRGLNAEDAAVTRHSLNEKIRGLCLRCVRD